MKEVIDSIVAEGFYTEEELIKGYIIIDDSGIMNGAKHIEKIDILDEYKLGKFKTDKEASVQAEKDGIQIIKDLTIGEDDKDFAYFIDTESNRKIINDFLTTRTDQ